MTISIHTLSLRLRLAFPPDPEMGYFEEDGCLEDAIHILKLLDGPNALASITDYLTEEFGGREYCSSVAEQILKLNAA